MPRHQKTRRICGEPLIKEFIPVNNTNTEIIYLTYDEYEVIKRVDFEGKTHEECAKIMNISRTTTTEIYDIARKKIADVMVNGKTLKIDGGNCIYCQGEAYEYCGKNCKKIKGEKENEILSM